MVLSTTEEELDTYLNDMRNMLDDLEVELKVKEERDKNFVFKYLYRITENEVRDILKSIKTKEFHKKVESTNESHIGELLYVWNPIRTFVDACGEKREIELYVKTYLDKKNKIVVVISFHEYNDFS